MEKMQAMEIFLGNPQGAMDELGESGDDFLIWVDWREYEEDLIDYFNEQLPVEEKVLVEARESDKPRGMDLFLTRKGRTLEIPFADTETDRDTALQAMQVVLLPDYEIRWFMESLGNDTLGFVLLASTEWSELEEKFGREKIEFFFAPIQPGRRMFSLDMNEVFSKREVFDQQKLERWGD